MEYLDVTLMAYFLFRTRQARDDCLESPESGNL